MASEAVQKVTFEIENVIQPIYTGGDVAISADGRILATCIEEDALLTNPVSGEALCRIEGDGEILTALQITPLASHLITCSRSLSMRIYSLDHDEDSHAITATLLRTLKPHTTPVVCATIHSKGTLIATGGADSTIKIWDIQKGYQTHTFKGHSGIISALRFFDNSEDVKDPSRRKPQKNEKHGSIDHEDDMIMLDDDLTQDSSLNTVRLASGGDDGKIRIWDLVKRKSVASLDSHVSVIRGLDFSTEQNALVSSSRDRTLTIWDAKSWKPRKVIPALEVLEDTVFIHEGKFICSGGEHGCVRVWATDTGKEHTDEQEAGNDADAIIRLLHSQDQVLMSIHADQSLKFYETEEAVESLTSEQMIPELPEIRRISGTHDEVIDLAYVTPRQELLALATNSESIRLVSVSSGDGQDASERPYFGADIAMLEGHDEIIICLSVDWSGNWIATGAKDNTARLWKIDHANSSYTCHAVLTGHAESIGAISLPTSVPPTDSAAYKDPLSHPPAFIITGSQDKTIKRWSVNNKADKKHSGKAIYTRRAHDRDINAIATNYGSTMFASASQDRTVKIWSIEEGEVQGILQGHKRGVWSVQFAPKETPSLPGDDNRVSNSRGLILTGAGDKTVKIWSLSDYTCLRTFEGTTNSVLKVLWLPPRPQLATDPVEDVEDDPNDTLKLQQQTPRKDSVLIASAGADGLVRIWDAQNGEAASTLDNHTDRIWALAAHPTDGTLISGGADSVVTFWRDTTSETATKRAQVATERIEQEQELLNHVHSGNYREAIVLALTLNHPGRLLGLFTDVTKRSPPETGSLSGLLAVDEVIGSLSDDQLFKLLLRIRDWSTNARTAAVAQRILWVIVRKYPAKQLISLGKVRGGKGLGDVLAAIQAYTERHYKRMEELLEESYIVDFVVRGMGEEGFVIANGNDTRQDQDMIMVE